MSESSPADLAVAFRSFARRRTEAIGDADPSALADLSSALDEHIAAAAAALGTSPDAAAVASELERRDPSDWDETTLATVRSQALDAGAVIRQIEARAAELTER